MCGKTYWIHSILQIVTCECTTAQVGGARPLTIDAWQCFLFDIRDCMEEWLLCFLLSFPLSLPFDWTLRCWVCCFVLLYFGCCVVLCVKKKEKQCKHQNVILCKELHENKSLLINNLSLWAGAQLHIFLGVCKISVGAPLYSSSPVILKSGSQDPLSCRV